MSDYVSREALTSVTRAGSQGLEGENPDKFPYEAFEVTKSGSENVLSMTSGWEIETGYNTIFGGTPEESPANTIFGGTP